MTASPPQLTLTPGRVAAVLFVVTLVLVAGPTASAAVNTQLKLKLKLTPSVGPPTTTTGVKGRGFGASERVDVAFDGTVLGVTTTHPNGAFSTSLSVPASAIPGEHTVSATGETSGLTAEATFLVRTDSPQFHFDVGHSGSNPYENILSPQTVAGLQLAWTGQAHDVVNFSSAIVGGIAYTVADDHVWAFDATSGAVVWSKVVAGPSASDPAVAAGVVYVGTLGHALYALDAATGKKRFTAPGPTGSPTVVDGVVYAGDDAGELYAIDAFTGARLWSHLLSFGHDIAGAPGVADGVVYAAANAPGGDSVFALDATTGMVLWSVDAGPVHGAPSVVDGVVYVGSTALYALDAATGATLWTGDIAGTDESTAVGNGLVFITSGYDLQAFKTSDGSLVWTKTLTGSLQTPSVSNGVVYVGSFDNAIHAFDAATGTELWSYATGAVTAPAPVIVNGYLYAGSFDDKFYAFHVP